MNEIDRRDLERRIDELDERINELERRLDKYEPPKPRELPTPLKSILRRAA